MKQRSSKQLVASDLMQREVVVVYDRDSLREAMNLMTENHVTRLPVVNAENRCVGMITATDILNYEQEHSEFISEANADVARYFNPETQQWESVRLTAFALEEFAEVRVEEVMSRSLVYVNLDTPIRDVARKMLQERIHRVLVINEGYPLFGLISAFDFVRLAAEDRAL